MPEIEGDKQPRKKFKAYPIGFFHIGITEVRTEEGKLHLFVAIDRTSKLAFAKLYKRATAENPKDLLEQLAESVPYKVHIVLTDNGIQFADIPKNRQGATAMFRGHPFDRVCWKYGIEHRLTKVGHPWTDGQAECMNRTIKEAAVHRYYYESHEQFQQHLDAFLCAYNFAKRLKTLKGLTPFQFIVKSWVDSPDDFVREPVHLNLGVYS